jgi:hypothetical protein
MKKISTLPLIPILLLATAILTACGKSDSKDKPDFRSWQHSTTTSRKIGGLNVPTASVLDCRKIQPASENVHYYYSVIANPKSKTTKKQDGKVTVTTYSQAQFEIEYTAKSPTGKDFFTRSLIYIDADFRVLESAEGKSFQVTANESTLMQYGVHRILGDLLVGSIMFELYEQPQTQPTKTKVNITPLDLPGLESGDTVECR